MNKCELKTAVASLAGMPYEKCRATMEALEFQELYPVVDCNGCLTGKIANPDDKDYIAVDCNAIGISAVDGSDALCDAYDLLYGKHMVYDYFQEGGEYANILVHQPAVNKDGCLTGYLISRENGVESLPVSWDSEKKCLLYDPQSNFVFVRLTAGIKATVQKNKAEWERLSAQIPVNTN